MDLGALLTHHGWVTHVDLDGVTSHDRCDQDGTSARIRGLARPDRGDIGMLTTSANGRRSARRIPADRLAAVVASSPGEEFEACGLSRGHLALADLLPGMVVKADERGSWLRLLRDEVGAGEWRVQQEDGRDSGVVFTVEFARPGYEVKPCFGVLRQGDVIRWANGRFEVASISRVSRQEVRVILAGEAGGASHGVSHEFAVRPDRSVDDVIRWAGER